MVLSKQVMGARVAVEPMVIEGSLCRDVKRSSALEWLETNGTGAFAMGTVARLNTRRYHSLLTASLQPPVDRRALLSRVEETLIDRSGTGWTLGQAQYPGTVSPRGYESLQEFRLDPFPVWLYQADGLTLEKKLFLVEGRQTAVIGYTADHAATLRVRPFFAFRDYHSLARRHDSFRWWVPEEGRVLRIQMAEGPPLFSIHFGTGAIQNEPLWYYRHEYQMERDRGLDFEEDLFTPGLIEVELQPGRTCWLMATTEAESAYSPALCAELEERERERRRTPVEVRDPFLRRLWQAADAFMARRLDGSATILAGYPWFTDWGRDTMISLPGLLTSRGKHAEARSILEGFLRHRRFGLIPNRFPDHGGDAEYNTADGTLWLFIAARHYLRASDDWEFLHSYLYPAALEILDWHRRGTLYGIGEDPEDGLLRAGDENSQLTWMDARVNGVAVTPRHGKAVELNALYFNALRITAEWAERHGDLGEAAALHSRATRLEKSFREKFWNAERQCLYDTVGLDGRPDATVRPNQIFAVSLPYSPVSVFQARAVVEIVERELLTPFGLRTLASSETEYRSHYGGGVEQRDSAYHQGTVWPWLVGPFVTAYLRAFGRNEDSLGYCRRLVLGFEPHIWEGCLGQVTELFDAEPPHRSGGASAQAWSVAELIRVLQEELD